MFGSPRMSHDRIVGATPPPLQTGRERRGKARLQWPVRDRTVATQCITYRLDANGEPVNVQRYYRPRERGNVAAARARDCERRNREAEQQARKQRRMLAATLLPVADTWQDKH